MTDAAENPLECDRSIYQPAERKLGGCMSIISMFLLVDDQESNYSYIPRILDFIFLGLVQKKISTAGQIRTGINNNLKGLY